jgi:hypothetical protein
MSPLQARYVTACQQVLALGVVVIALVPATRVVTLDVVGVRPGAQGSGPTVAVPDASSYTQRPPHARSIRVAERAAARGSVEARRALGGGDGGRAGVVGARHQDQRAG